MENNPTPGPRPNVVLPALRARASETAGPRALEKWFNGVFVLALLTLILFVLAYATFPMIASDGGGVALSSEARAALGLMKDRARVVYERTGKAPGMDDLGLGPVDLEGSDFHYSNYSCGGDAKHLWAKCTGVYKSEPLDLMVTADLETGSATFNR
jgi:hypothetical protein